MTGHDRGVEAVTFDIDGTVCTFVRSRREILSRTFEKVGVDQFYTVEEYYDRFPEYQRSDTPHLDCITALVREYGHDESLAADIAANYGNVCQEVGIEATAGVPGAIDALPSDLGLGVITNGTAEFQLAKLESVGLAGRFDTVVVAGEDVDLKPAPEPFETALADLNAAPERTVHVGNSASSDVTGANRCGLRSVLVDDDALSVPDDVTPDHTIDTLHELPALVETMS